MRRTRADGTGGDLPARLHALPGDAALRGRIADELTALRALLTSVEREVRELRRSVDELRHAGVAAPPTDPRPGVSRSRSHRIW